jgi:beta-galactosidase GanA
MNSRLDTFRTRIGGYAFGGDYNPEQWAAPPAWLAYEHPETLPVAEDGHVFGFGNRLQFDPTSAVYLGRAARITHAVAERYSHHRWRSPCSLT